LKSSISYLSNGSLIFEFGHRLVSQLSNSKILCSQPERVPRGLEAPLRKDQASDPGDQASDQTHQASDDFHQASDSPTAENGQKPKIEF